MKPAEPIPSDPAAWLTEIAAAYIDARETIPVAHATGHPISEHDLWEIAPVVCLKFRGIESTRGNLKRVHDAAVSSFIATEEIDEDLFGTPQMAFAFSYVASHFGLDLLTDEQCEEITEYVESHLQDLVEMTGGA